MHHAQNPLDAGLMAEASRASGLPRKTDVIHLGLRLVVQREAAERLAARGGSDPKASAAPRRKRVGG